MNKPIKNNKFCQDWRGRFSQKNALFLFLFITSIGLISCARIEQTTTSDKPASLDDKAPTAPNAQTAPPKRGQSEEQEAGRDPMKKKPDNVDAPPEFTRVIKPEKVHQKIPEKIAEPIVPQIIPAPIPPAAKPEPSKEFSKIPSPSSRTIERPTSRKSKLKKEFTTEEEEIDKKWSAKASVLASILQNSGRLEMRTELAQEMQQLSDEQFAFITTQPYFWSSIMSGHLNIISSILSAEKLSIVADVIVNENLIKRDPNIPTTLQNLIRHLDTGDSEDFAKLPKEDQEKFKQETSVKLKAFLKAATIDGQIGDVILNKASAYSRATGDMKGYKEILEKLKEAKAMLAEYVGEKAEKQKTMAIETPKPKTPSPWDKPKKLRPAVERAEKISVDINAIKNDLFGWLNKKDYTIDSNDLLRHKKYLRAFLKLYPTAESDKQELMKKAFQEMVAQHSPLNNFLNILDSITDENELKLFMKLFPAHYNFKGRPIDTMKSLWDKELDSFAGASVREEQKDRLVVMFGALDEQQQENSFKVSNFWVLLENQPEAAAIGLSPEAYKNIVTYLLKHDRLRITSFANKVISKIKDDEINPEKMVEIFRALKPLAKTDGEMEKTLTIKKSAFQIKYRTDPQIETWKKLMDQPL